MRRSILTASAVTILLVLVLPLMLHTSGSFCAIDRASAQDNPCLVQDATISALELANLQLQLTNDALMDGAAPAAAATVIVTVEVIITATPSAQQAVMAPSVTPAPVLTPGMIVAQANDTFGDVNVRALPAPSAELVTILPVGESLPVTGRFFRWLRVQADEGEAAWVFDGVVSLVGDVASIPDIDPPPELASALSVFQLVSASVTGDVATESVQIRNTGGTIDITGWELVDEDDNAYTFPQILFFSEGEITLNTGEGVDTPVELFRGAVEPLLDSGETLTLIDAAGDIQASFVVP